VYFVFCPVFSSVNVTVYPNCADVPLRIYSLTLNPIDLHLGFQHTVIAAPLLHINCLGLRSTPESFKSRKKICGRTVDALGRSRPNKAGLNVHAPVHTHVRASTNFFPDLNKIWYVH